MIIVKEEIIDSLSEWGNLIQSKPDSLQETIESAYQHNKWFTPENIEYALQSITSSFLKKEKLEEWLSKYELRKRKQPLKVGIIMAGNLPLVGFHDLLSVLITNNIALIKLSSKDNILLPYLLEQLFEINPELKNKIEIVERLNNAEAIIATGSNNSSRYFEYYFARFPKIIRRNRGSVAILSGKETNDDFLNIGTDIFRYFGLGCRNVSKLFIPENYSFDKFYEGISGFSEIINHNKYKNNYDYNGTLLLMNKTPHLSNDFLMLQENNAVSSPVAILYYEKYSSPQDLQSKLDAQRKDIQCIAGENYIPFGKTQNPELWEYADDIDTVDFMCKLQSVS